MNACSVKQRVLIVDDEPHIVAYLETLLQDNGYETMSASNGRTGLAIAARDKPDLIILDLMMPLQTGTELYKNLLCDGELGRIPVIVVSAVPDRHLAVRTPFAVFDKPIDPDVLLSAVRGALGT